MAFTLSAVHACGFYPNGSWGNLVPTSEHSSKVVPTRRHKALFESAVELSSTADQDWVVFGKVVRGYEPVASEKKKEANAHENSLSRLGNGNKQDKKEAF